MGYIMLEISKEMVELFKARKINCWDFVKCGREFGGEKVTEMGVCPASIDISANGLNDGKKVEDSVGLLQEHFVGKKYRDSSLKAIIL